MRRRGWNDVIVYLPHDGVATNNITGKRYIDHWTEAGFECGIPIKNTGAGAAMMRIEAARRVLPRCWFNESTTEAGRDAFGYYHERQDEKRSIGLDPEHDWSSHAGRCIRIWQSLTRSRRLIPGGLGDRHPHASALTGRTEFLIPDAWKANPSRSF
jgi:hypothetical protein